MVRIVLARAGEVIATVDGSFTLAEAFVREVLAFAPDGPGNPRQDAFIGGLSRDGYVVSYRLAQSRARKAG